MNIIGISAFYHDSACCLISDGILVAAAQEERFSRKKNDPDFPIQALKYCMAQGGILITDIDCIAYYENPVEKLARQIWSGHFQQRNSDTEPRFDPNRPLKEIREKFGYEGPIKFYDHHRSHAASSFYYSGFSEAAIMTVDGVGEWTTTSYGFGDKLHIHELHHVEYPDSIGLLYSAITNYLGFEVNEGEYKVMGLAPYGSPKYLSEFDDILQLRNGYDFNLNSKYFDFLNPHAMFTAELCELLGNAGRLPGTPLNQFHFDIASSLQKTLEAFLLAKTTFLKDQTGLENLCLSGGVGLNCVANRAILDNGKFKKIFVPPGSNDAGCAIGAAKLASLELNESCQSEKMTSAFLGPQYDNKEILALLIGMKLTYGDYQGHEIDLIKETAKLLYVGKVVGWFQGRMEFGPRALGARSILADPRNPNHRNLINSMVKKRESFRPFAPTVIEDRAHEFFDIDHASPFMLETCPVISPVSLPAVTHVDGSARLQTVNRMTNQKYYDLLAEFGAITGCPILLNTSFNVNKEPIVCSPVDALRCFIKSNIDVLVIGDFILEREKNVIDELQVKILSEDTIQRGIIDSLYTFI